uniref:MADS-box domain-containing protein n=1 Tax=Kalanchoe fedtschenkoi TaxID=63787 RepID=A0A7N0TTT1_KALFE
MERSAAAAAMKKTSRGRQKIPMKLIEDKEDRVITFSKRKAGIFKKASEISIMCGAKVLFILFSPTGKAYSFAHPSVKTVADKFLGQEESEGGKQIRQILENHLNKRLEKLLLHHSVARSELEAVNEQVRAMSAAMESENKGWWEANVSEMSSVEEVEQVMKSISDFEVALSNHFEKLKQQTVGGEGSGNINHIVAPYDQLGDVNIFPPQMNDNVQMPNWAGGNNLSNGGSLGGVDNLFDGVNGAGLCGVGYGGSLPAAGNYGDSLGQGDGFIMPAAGSYGGTLGQGSDYSMLAAANGGALGQGTDHFSLPAAGNYGSTLGLGNGFSLPVVGNYGGTLDQGNGFSLPVAGNYGGALGQENCFSMPAAGNYGGALGQENCFSMPAAGDGGTGGHTDDVSVWPGGTAFNGAGLYEGGSSGAGYSGDNFGADFYGTGYGGNFMDGLPGPASGFQGPC